MAAPQRRGLKRTATFAPAPWERRVRARQAPARARSFRAARGENKFFDTSVDDAVIAATMAITNLGVIPEGDGESERVGRKITVSQVLWKYQCIIPSTAAVANTSDIIKMFLVMDTQTNGAVFTSTDLLDTDVWDSFRNLSNTQRFKVLWTHDMVLKAQAGAGNGTADAFAEDTDYVIGGKKVSIPIQYDNTFDDGRIGTVRSNNLYWVT